MSRKSTYMNPSSVNSAIHFNHNIFPIYIILFPLTSIMALEFETNGLYLLLSQRGDTYTFHWGLYLAKTPKEGEIFHLINPKNSAAWRYEHKLSANLGSSNRLVLALKVAVMELALHDALRARLSQIPIQDSTRFRERITCRVWIKEALFALDDEGYIKLTGTVDQIEQDAKNKAMANKSQGTKTVSKSALSQS